MAKEDFCFTYYDGDAARDKAHMDRLERGAYDDIISAQRKKGRLSLDDIKKVLSKDFERCWPSLEWILKKDTENKYFIEWVENSIEKMRKHAKKQSDNRKGKTKENQTVTKLEPNNNQKKPLEDGNGNGIEDKDFKYELAKIENKIEDVDQRFTEIFDELYLDRDVRPAFRGIDLPDQVVKFKAKVRGSPDEYKLDDTGRMRNAFLYQLRQVKPDKPSKNGISKDKLEQFRKR